LLAEPNIITSHDVLEVHGYFCVIIEVEESGSISCQLASKVLLPSSDGINSATTCLLCSSPSSNPESRYAIDIAIPFVDNFLFIRFNMLKNL
jgi:hypothetical protein